MLAMLGASKITSDSSSATLVKTLQKLTLATVAAQSKLEGQEKAAAERLPEKGIGPRKEKPAKRKTAKKTWNWPN